MTRSTITITIFSIGMLMAGAASATDEETKQRIKHELTASIPATGVHALHDIRQSLASDLPRGLPLKQQMEQLRAAFGQRQSSDRI